MQNSISSSERTFDTVDYPYLAILIGSEFKFFRPTDILYCKADGNHTKIVFENGNATNSTKKLKELELLLPADIFVRVHHSYIINITHVIKYDNDESQELEMLNGEKVMVSRRKKNHFLSNFIKL